MSTQFKWYLWSAIITSLFLIVWHAFQWSLIDPLTPFLYGPIAGLAKISYFAAAAASFVCLFGIKKFGKKAFLPLSVIVITFLIMSFVPFTNLWLKADFAFYKTDREAIVEKVRNGDLVSNVAHNSRLVALGDSYPYVSRGGNEIVVEEHNGKKYIFFFSYRGILDNYSGYVNVPEGGKPEDYSDLHETSSTQIVHLVDSWYFASHR